MPVSGLKIYFRSIKINIFKNGQICLETLYIDLYASYEPPSNFQDSSLSKSAQNGVSTFVKIACEFIGNKETNV